MNEYKEALLHKTKLISVLETILQSKFMYSRTNNYEKMYVEVLKKALIKNVNLIFALALSETEKKLLNGLVIMSTIYNNGFPFWFTNSLSSANEDMNDIARIYVGMAKSWSAQESMTEKESYTKLTEYINNSNYSEKDKEIILNNCQTYIFLKQQKAFHVSMHPVFTNIKIDGQYFRPDILIWLPFDPKFRLIVEINDFDSHALANDGTMQGLSHLDGFQVLRFSSKEIINNPLDKAKELYDYLVMQKAISVKEQAEPKLDDYRAALLSREKMYSVLTPLLEDIMDDYFPVKGKNQNAVVRKMQLDVMKMHVDVVFDYAKSDLEKIFLNIFLSIIYSDKPFSFHFTNPLPSITTNIDELRIMYKKCMNIFKTIFDSEEKVDAMNFWKYIEYIKNFDEIPEETKDLIIDFSFNYILFRSYEHYHISIQSTFTDIEVNGKNIRPDIFIWIPAKPSFKLIVECDEFNYYSGKTSFSNDRARDRDLQVRGFQVLRFSAQEIFDDPFGKVRELYDYLIAQETASL